MKKLNIKIKPEVMLTIGSLVLGGAQLLLTNKKDAADRAKMEEEIIKKLSEKAINK